jgi:hypothetical protein
MIGLFELGRRNIAEQFEQAAAAVVPRNPLERRALDVLKPPPTAIFPLPMSPRLSSPSFCEAASRVKRKPLIRVGAVSGLGWKVQLSSRSCPFGAVGRCCQGSPVATSEASLPLTAPTRRGRNSRGVGVSTIIDKEERAPPNSIVRRTAGSRPATTRPIDADTNSPVPSRSRRAFEDRPFGATTPDLIPWLYEPK